jgi:Na+/melibiose symporter-like transporter
MSALTYFIQAGAALFAFLALCAAAGALSAGDGWACALATAIFIVFALVFWKQFSVREHIRGDHRRPS